MDKQRFEAILDAYGADARRWPAAERAAAEAFAAAHALDLSEARALDALLDEARENAAPTELLNARILRDAKISLGARPAPPRVVSPYAALAASLVFGILFGYGIGASAPPGEEIDAMLMASLAGSDQDWSGFGG